MALSWPQPGVERPSLSAVRALVGWGRRHAQILCAFAVAAVAGAAYRLTLRTLLANLGLDTPLAYLPLLPFIALALAIVVIQRHRAHPAPARDRIVDLVVGLPLMIVALFLISVVPAVASTYYWSDRPDVLSLACFTTGAIIMIFGLGWFWRLRWPLVFLLLAWPALYLRFLTRMLLEFTDVTNGVLAKIVPHLPLGVSPGASSGTLVIAQAHAAPITVSVSTACAGADGVLAFALIGGAFLTTRTGALSRRLLWLLTGMLIAFAMNVLRITSVLGLVALGHPDFALGAYHAVIGLVIFSLVVSVMAVLTPRFGLDAPATVEPQKAARPPRALSARTRLISGVALAAFTGLVGVADASLAPYAAFADGSGAPRVGAFTPAAVPANWTVSHLADYPWAAQYFGRSSTFQRFTVTDRAGHLVYADVVRTKNRSALAAYNVQNCFLFHRYHIDSNQRTDLGSGVTGLLLSYTVDATKAKWSTVSWAWPIRSGGDTYYERILLTGSTAALGSFTAAKGAASVASVNDGWLFRVLGRVMGQQTARSPVVSDANAQLHGIAQQLVTAAVRTHTA